VVTDGGVRVRQVREGEKKKKNMRPKRKQENGRKEKYQKTQKIEQGLGFHTTELPSRASTQRRKKKKTWKYSQFILRKQLTYHQKKGQGQGRGAAVSGWNTVKSLGQTRAGVGHGEGRTTRERKKRKVKRGETQHRGLRGAAESCS